MFTEYPCTLKKKKKFCYFFFCVNVANFYWPLSRAHETAIFYVFPENHKSWKFFSRLSNTAETLSNFRAV